MRQLREQSPVFDLHCDAVLKLFHKNAKFSQDNSVSHVDIPKVRAGNVSGLIYSLWADPVFDGELAVKRTQLMLDTAKSEIELCRDDLWPTATARDLDDSIQRKKISAMLGIEGGRSINNSLQTLEDFFRQGVRRMTLTHTGSTDWAGSATDEGSDRGLSEFGKDVVRCMNDLGMVVDVAHTCEKTFLDTVKVSKKPVFCTHSLARSVFNAERLATDDMILAIRESGGIFGVTFLPAFFSNQNEDVTKKWMETLIRKLREGGSGATLDEKAQDLASIFMDTPPPSSVAPLSGVLPHMDHVINLIGEDHVAIGTDFDGIPFGAAGLENCSKFDNLRLAMKNHGYSDERISKILGGNARRVLKEILPTG